MVFPVVMYGCESWAIKKALEIESMAATGNTVLLLMVTIKKMVVKSQRSLKTQWHLVPPLHGK